MSDLHVIYSQLPQMLAVIRQTSYTYHTWQQSYILYAYLSAGDRLCVYQKLFVGCDAAIVIINACNHGAENQNDATIVAAIFVFCHYYIVCELNNAGEARGQSWKESLKSRYILGGLCGLFEWYKVKTFRCAFVAAAMLTMVAAATIVRFPQCWWRHDNIPGLYWCNQERSLIFSQIFTKRHPIARPLGRDMGVFCGFSIW